MLGKKSGIDSIRIKAAELGLELSEEERARLCSRPSRRAGAEKRGLVSDDELAELARTLHDQD